ncbi:MAG: hypothetical protein ACRC6T_03330 [Sarcina sp.]
MFGFVSRDSKIVQGITDRDGSYVLKFIKKYKKIIFRNIKNGDKDYIFSNIVLEMVQKITNDESIKLGLLVKEYIEKIKDDKLDIKGFEIYNDRDLLKHIIKEWEDAKDRGYDYCEIFNSLLENEIPEAGNEPCYSMVSIHGDIIDIKQFSNDFSVYYQDEDDCYTSDFKNIDHMEIKKNTQGQATGEDIFFKDDFSTMVWAQTITDSENIERLQILAQQHGVIKGEKKVFKL